MKIEELEKEHYKWVGKIIASEKVAEKHTKLSIQFAIEILEDFNQFYVGDCLAIYADEINDKIEELKNYLK